MIKTPLYNHTSEDTAYLVNDYPYGFTLRCQIRYWIEDSEKKGFRFCSQTTNPKKSGTVWNKPKKSTYRYIGSEMYLDEKDYVQCAALTEYSSAEDVRSFVFAFSGMSPQKRSRIQVWVKQKILYLTARISGAAEWTINGVAQETPDAEKDRYREELKVWESIFPIV